MLIYLIYFIIVLFLASIFAEELRDNERKEQESNEIGYIPAKKNKIPLDEDR